MHQLEGIVDFFERHGVGNQIVDVDFSFHIPIDDLGNIRAAPRHTRPVTSWNGRVEISWPAPATPMMMLSPHPRWQHSSACRMVPMLPMHSNEKSAPPAVRSTIACTTLSRPTSSGLMKCVM